VNRRRTLSGFELHEQSLLHEQVQARFTDSSTFVEDIDSDLPEKTNAMFCQLLAEGFLIKGLQKPGAQRAMNLNGRPITTSVKRFKASSGSSHRPSLSAPSAPLRFTKPHRPCHLQRFSPSNVSAQ
jgi:hypothetical protein